MVNEIGGPDNLKPPPPPLPKVSPQANKISQIADQILSDPEPHLPESLNPYDRALRGFPEEKLFYFYIDLDRVLLGPDCFDKKEPGYRTAMEQGFAYIKKTIRQLFGQAEFNRLHEYCTTGVATFENRTSYRDDSVYYDLKKPLTEEALEELSEIFIQPGIKLSQCVELTRFFVLQPKLSRAEIALVVDYFFSTYYKEIDAARSEDDRLRAIVTLCRSLEVFHPFADGNQRTIVFTLLTKLLIEQGFSPAILKDPYIFDGYETIDSLMAAVRDGIARFEYLKQAPLNEEDLQYIMEQACTFTKGNVARHLLLSNSLNQLPPEEIQLLLLSAFNETDLRRNTKELLEFVSQLKEHHVFESIDSKIITKTLKDGLYHMCTKNEVQVLGELLIASGQASNIPQEELKELYQAAQKAKMADLEAFLKDYLNL